LYGKDGKPLIDYMALAGEEPPAVVDGGEGVTCRHPFRQQHRLKVYPSRVEPLHHLVFDGKAVPEECPQELSKTREYVLKQIQESFPESVTRYDDPQEYHVMVSLQLYEFLHSTWEKEAPIDEME
jgi:hypothetical protein